MPWGTLVGVKYGDPISSLNHDSRALNPLLVLNFKKFHKAQFNLEFNKTSAIGFLTQFII